MKKLIAIILCLAMCCGLLAMTASAAGGYYVAGTEGLCGVAWDAGAEANKMTANSDGTYSITYEDVPVGEHEFKITDGTWDNDWGSNGYKGYNYWFKLDAPSDVTITFDPSTETITLDANSLAEAEVPEIDFMALRGSGADLSWEADNVKMTKVSDGVYEYTFKNLSDTSIEMKFAANGNWSDYNFGGAFSASGAETTADWNGGNINFGVTEKSDVTVKLDLTDFDYTTKQGATFTITITPVASSGDGGSQTEATTGSETEGTTDSEDTKVDTITVYAKVPADWTTVCAYIWDGNGTDNTWPGAEMTKGSNGWYSVELPVWGKNIIINNGGNGAQTQDIAIEEGKDLWIVVSATDDGFTGTLTYEAPKTGDSIAVFVALMAVSALGIAVIGKKKFF